MSPLSWFDAEDAPGRRNLESCIHCGLCLTACPTYRELKEEPDSPRGRLYLMRGLSEGRIAPDDDLVGHLDLCLGCRACESVCPAGVPYGRLLEETRGQIERRRPARGLGRRLGLWALETLFPERQRLHLAADVLRLSQHGPLAALARLEPVRRALPGFARAGIDLTPPIVPRDERALEAVAPMLPAGARMEWRPEGLVFHPAGAAHAHVGFFTGCVMEVMFPHVNHEAVRLMVLAGCRVTVPSNQTCCGALHAHAGERRTSKKLARRNLVAFGPGLPERAEPSAAADLPAYDYVVTDSAGCGAALREAGHLLHDEAVAGTANAFAARVRDLAEVLAEVGLPDPPRPIASFRDPDRPLRVTYHDPCHLAHAQGVRAAPRALLRKTPGIEMVEMANSDWCCGSAGVYNLAHPDMADAQLEHKLDTIEQADPEVVVASNPGCALHIARGAGARGMPVELMHLVELLGRAHPPRAGS